MCGCRGSPWRKKPTACLRRQAQERCRGYPLDNLKAAVALYVAYYNLCRVHLTLRVSPAMEAGLTDHVWSIEELLLAGRQVMAA